MNPAWIDWTQRLQAIAQNGLTFARDPYDIERYLAARRRFDEQEKKLRAIQYFLAVETENHVVLLKSCPGRRTAFFDLPDNGTTDLRQLQYFCALFVYVTEEDSDIGAAALLDLNGCICFDQIEQLRVVG